MTNKDYMRMTIEKMYAEKIKNIAENVWNGNYSAADADNEVRRADIQREKAFNKIRDMERNSLCYPEGN